MYRQDRLHPTRKTLRAIESPTHTDHNSRADEAVKKWIIFFFWNAVQQFAAVLRAPPPASWLVNSSRISFFPCAHARTKMRVELIRSCEWRH